MGVIRIAVKIGSVSAPGAHGLEADDLRARVENELAQLLALEPLQKPPRDGATIAVAGGAVRASSLASPATVAHAIARRVHAGLRAEERGQ
jgi:hypothetical protein